MSKDDFVVFVNSIANGILILEKMTLNKSIVKQT
jgi:hypothetical protein